jgi:hypothetical protein
MFSQALRLLARQQRAILIDGVFHDEIIMAAQGRIRP